MNGNKLREVPRELGQLSNLWMLELGGNKLREVPRELGQLSNLWMLELSDNELRNVPAELGQLSNLHMLSLIGNQLKEVPAELGQLSNLQGLFLEMNTLREVPAELGQLSNLRTLSLGANALREVPFELGQLSNLRTLDLGTNDLRDVLLELGQLSNLEELTLGDNPKLLTPPPEIVAQGTQTILAFLRELQQNSYTRYEAKLILVGQGATGKSSLLRALYNKPFDAELPTTHGIEVETLSLPHPTLPDTTLKLNTWDFGGQDIYRATHQFFLTKRSLYLVVWNARQDGEQGRLDYWLHTIRVLAPDAPILLIATHIDERTPDLNVPRYRAEYPQIVDSLQISSKTGAGIPELRAALAHYAAELPLTGQPWPASWVAVEQALLARSDHHISEDEYADICKENDVERELAQGSLGSYLHDLGKILYYRDDGILKKFVILKPNWVTKAISFALEDTLTRDQNGILAHADLPRIWYADEQGERYDPKLHPIFLRLMERFDLCYQIEAPPGMSPTQSLIPQLLPHQPPAVLPTWQPEDAQKGLVCVKMTYRLDFVPAGIMSWFIVRTHRYTNSTPHNTNSTHWREGVVLKHQEHFARAELFPQQKELRLEVWGVEPRTFLVILKDVIDLILSRFTGLHIERLVPCICQQATPDAEPCPGFFRYADLEKCLQKRKAEIQCHESFEDVSVQELLYGIHISTGPQVNAVITQSQQEILDNRAILQQLGAIQQGQREMLYKQDAQMDAIRYMFQLVLRVNQLCEWNVRQHARLWNLEMKKMEVECPNTFFITQDSVTPFNPKNWIRRNYRLFLLCQHPSGPHQVKGSKGYPLPKTKEWWVKFSPWLKHAIQFLKFGVPIAGAVAGVVFDENAFKQMEKQIDLLEKMTDALPDLASHDALSLEEGRHLGGFERSEGAALRVLYSFLKEADPHGHWDGLEKVYVEGDTILWLCEEHAKPYKPVQLVLP